MIEDFLSKVTEALPVGVAVYQKEIFYVNSTFLKNSKFDKSDVNKSPFIQFFENGQRDILEEAIDRRVKGENFKADYNLKFFTKEGEKDIHLQATTFEYGGRYYGLGIFEDKAAVLDSDVHEGNKNFNLGEGFYYSFDTKSVYRESGIEIALFKKEVSILEFLIKNRGKLVTYEMIVAHIWSDMSISLNTLRWNINSIRKKTYKDLILNQSGIGYRLNI